MQMEETTYGHPLGDRTMAFAEMCFWRTGRYLAKKMRENGFEPNERGPAARMADRRSLQGGKDAGLFNSLPDERRNRPLEIWFSEDGGV